MKILHTSDWHLGKSLEQHPRIDEQIEVLEEIVHISNERQVDVILISGDLFDVYNPPTRAVEIFYKYLKKLSNNARRPVIAIAGNHDSPDRIEAPDPLAKECGIFFFGYPGSKHQEMDFETGLKITKVEEGFMEIHLPNVSFPLRIIATPYANEKRLKTYLGIENEEEELRKHLAGKWSELSNQYCDENGVNVLMSHLFMMNLSGEKPMETDSEKPIIGVGGTEVIYTNSIPSNIQYVALGHLHRCQTITNTPCPIVYSGSPLAYSMSEANQEKFVILLDLEPNKDTKIEKIPLSKCIPVFRKKFSSVEEAIVWLRNNQNCYVELTIQLKSFMSSDEFRKLNNAHDKIVTIIPEVLEQDESEETRETKIDLNKSFEELFVEYFKYHKGGMEPSKEIMELFNEMSRIEEEE